MWKVNLAEIFNKVCGIVIVALISRTLGEEYGTYLYYQNIFAYLLAFTMFATDYKNLIEYKKDCTYLSSDSFFFTIYWKLFCLFLIVLAAPFIFKYFDDFSFLPYFVSLGLTPLVFDFVLYVENKKAGFVIVRMISQFASIILALLFYKRIIPLYHITWIQPLQTIFLTTLTLIIAWPFIKPSLTIRKFSSSLRKLKIEQFFELASYFYLRKFFLIFTTFEIFVLTFFRRFELRDIFTEGLRLSNILMPFVVFYVSFNLGNSSKKYSLNVFLLCLLLIVFSPLYVLLLFGVEFYDKIFYYNFFVIVFFTNSLVERDLSNYLLDGSSAIAKLNRFNLFWQLGSIILFLSVILFMQLFGVELRYIVFIYAIKFLVYLFSIESLFLKVHKNQSVFYGVLVILCNIVLYKFGFFVFAFDFLSGILTWVKEF